MSTTHRKQQQVTYTSLTTIAGSRVERVDHGDVPHTVDLFTDLIATADELNVVDGITATVAELNILDGVTATASELNALDGITASVAELNITDGVTATAAEINALDGITATVTELNTTDLSAVGAVYKVKKIAIAATPTGVEQDTTFDLPAKCVLLDVIVDVTTAEATGTTKTLDVGLLSSESGGDADGFIDGLSVAATGLKRASAATTTGSLATYLSATTRGVLLGTFLVGADVIGAVGSAFEKPHLATLVTAKSITYTAGSNNFAQFRGAIYLLYVEMG